MFPDFSRVGIFCRDRSTQRTNREIAGAEAEGFAELQGGCGHLQQGPGWVRDGGHGKFDEKRNLSTFFFSWKMIEMAMIMKART